MSAKIYKSLVHDAVEGSIQLPRETGGDPINMLNGLTYNAWIATASGTSSVCTFDNGVAVTPDCFAFDGHNLLDVFSSYTLNYVRLEGSNDSTFTTTTILATLNLEDMNEGANVLEFVNVTAYRYYRIVLQNNVTITVNPIISIFYIGKTITLPEGIKPSYTPPRLGIDADIMNNESQGGNFIGRSKRRTSYRFIIKNELVDDVWINANWLDLYSYIEMYPFFYLWNDADADDVVFCWTLAKVPPPRYTDQCHMAFSFNCMGFV